MIVTPSSAYWYLKVNRSDPSSLHTVGAADGEALGKSEGLELGIADGKSLGDALGVIEGLELGITDGKSLGEALDVTEGLELGLKDGELVVGELVVGELVVGGLVVGGLVDGDSLGEALGGGVAATNDVMLLQGEVRKELRMMIALI
jgi:hypothetical protein